MHLPQFSLDCYGVVPMNTVNVGSLSWIIPHVDIFTMSHVRYGNIVLNIEKLRVLVLYTAIIIFSYILASENDVNLTR